MTLKFSKSLKSQRSFLATLNFLCAPRGRFLRHFLCAALLVLSQSSDVAKSAAPQSFEAPPGNLEPIPERGIPELVAQQTKTLRLLNYLKDEIQEMTAKTESPLPIPQSSPASTQCESPPKEQFPITQPATQPRLERKPHAPRPVPRFAKGTMVYHRDHKENGIITLVRGHKIPRYDMMLTTGKSLRKVHRSKVEPTMHKAVEKESAAHEAACKEYFQSQKELAEATRALSKVRRYRTSGPRRITASCAVLCGPPRRTAPGQRAR